MDKHIVFYDYVSRSKIVIDDYNESDKLNSYNIKRSLLIKI